MRISIVLTDPTLKQVGGYKMVYIYANALVKRGHDVHIYYRRYSQRSPYAMNVVDSIFRSFISAIEPRWFDLDSRIRKSKVEKLTQKMFLKSDVIILTAVVTASEFYNLNINEKKVIYFIQDYENWGIKDEKLRETYRYGYKNIVVAKWLKNIVDKYSIIPSLYIKNGIDLEKFNLLSEKSIENRKRYTIAMLYHNQKRKNSAMGLEVLKRLKNDYPEMKAYLFGTVARDDKIPAWVEYTEKASTAQLMEIYNKSAVFMCTSNIEGFGLTGLESMACGCALVSTKCKGVMEYAVDGYNSLLSDVEDIEAMVNNIKKLFDNPLERIQISKNAYKDAQKFDVYQMVDMFCKEVEG